MNLASSHFRRRAAARRAVTKLAARPQEVHRDPDAGEALEVRRAVASLPRRDRQVLILRHYLGLSVEEVAEVTSLPEGTVKTITRRAIASLRKSDHLIQEEVTDAL
jgi:RNA polymerase sigma factor (sigma-70 family)